MAGSSPRIFTSLSGSGRSSHRQALGKLAWPSGKLSHGPGKDAQDLGKHAQGLGQDSQGLSMHSQTVGEVSRGLRNYSRALGKSSQSSGEHAQPLSLLARPPSGPERPAGLLNRSRSRQSPPLIGFRPARPQLFIGARPAAAPEHQKPGINSAADFIPGFRFSAI